MSDAISRLRSVLADTDTTKFVFKTKVVPPPDGVTTQFLAGHQLIVPGTLRVFSNGVELTGPSGVIPEYQTGTFEVTGTPPLANTDLRASYYYKWFTDPQLEAYLNAAAESLKFTDITDQAMDVGLRPAVSYFAACEAYMAKAAESASSLTASAAGFTFDRTHSNPNWRAMAEIACQKASDLVTQFATDPLSSTTPQISIVTYRQQIYQPRS